MSDDEFSGSPQRDPSQSADPAPGAYQPPPAPFGAYPTTPAGGYPSGAFGYRGDYGAAGAAAGDGEPARGRTRPGLRSRLGGLPLLVTAVVAALIGGGVGAATVALSDDDGGSTNTGLKVTDQASAPAPPANGSIGAAAARIRPSVVTIDVSGGQAAGTGSGVIIRADGYILTNDHVVSLGTGGGTLRVVLADGRTAPATIVGRDPSDDLAVVKVSGLSGLPAATFGRSSGLTVGQTVVAVGAPLGLSDTVTSGIVSNTTRPVRAGDNDQAVFQAIQTDAAINPGNSGGPLVDLNGSVVGINAAIATDSSGGGLQVPGQTQQSGNIGIGFAIPSDEASRIAGELIASGKAFHAILGVSVQSSATSNTAGVRLSAVNSGGAAQKAGLKVGDIVTAVAHTRVTTADSLIAAIRSHAPGEKVAVTYLRDGKSSTTTVTLDKSAT